MTNNTYNANLFELKRFEPLHVYVYRAEFDPSIDERKMVFQILGRVALRLTKSLRTAAISDDGRIKVLESRIDEQQLVIEDEPEIGTRVGVNLFLEEEKEVDFSDSPEEYGRLVNRIVDLAMIELSQDYYKYSIRSPYIIERGDAYFDIELRERTGIEDGRRFYRGIRSIHGIPHLLINREIELRSWKNLLNELKSLANWWQELKGEDMDFYQPSERFVSFINHIFVGRTAHVKAYQSRPVEIRGITWEVRAKDRVLNGGISPKEYHQNQHGKTLEDDNQPLVRWRLDRQDGTSVSLYHVPEFLVVGHSLEDLKMRVPKSQRSQVFDILQPNCSDQFKKTWDFVRKVDRVLRREFPAVYPGRIEISGTPRDVNSLVVPPAKIELSFGNKTIEISPPYGSSFYSKYAKGIRFAAPISEGTKVLAICNQNERSFVERIVQEMDMRNGCKSLLTVKKELDFADTSIPQFDLVITISDDEDVIRRCKTRLVNELGIAHQNIRKDTQSQDAIPQIAMQLTLKLGGFTWLLAEPIDASIMSVYSFRDPFSETRFYLFNIMSPEGRIQYQSPPFDREHTLDLLRSIHTKAREIRRLLILLSFDDQNIQEFILRDISPDVQELMLIQIWQSDELRLFSTFRPMAVSTPRRRRIDENPIDEIVSYEAVPEGCIVSTGKNEFYAITTASTRIGTYYRGCPVPIRIRILDSKGVFDVMSILKYILSLTLEAGTSGHETRLPAPLYYLEKLGWYIGTYGLPENKSIYEKIFYV
jgi:hypothetical protein